MKSKDLILLLVVAGVAYYLLKNRSGQTGITTAGAPVVVSQNPVGSPYEALHLSVTNNPLGGAIPGTSTAYNDVLTDTFKVDPNHPPPIVCPPGQWPGHDPTFTTWACSTPQLWI